MRRIMVVVLLLLVSAISIAAFDQAYVQTIAGDGSSIMEKTQTISLLIGQLPDDALDRLAVACQSGTGVICRVDKEAKTITLTERFTPTSGYYSYTTEQGIPFTTHVLVVSQLPTDVFGSALDKVMAAANLSSGEAVAPLRPINLAEDNSVSVKYMKKFKTNITYTIVMPTKIEEASAGAVVGYLADGAEDAALGAGEAGGVGSAGSAITFNVVDVLAARQPITVKAQEINWLYLVVGAGVIVLAVISASFFASRKPGKKSQAQALAGPVNTSGVQAGVQKSSVKQAKKQAMRQL